MEREKNFFDYAAQVLMIFGLTTACISLCSYIAGDIGKDLSTLFALGSQGLSFATMLQIMALSVLITLSRFLFFSDRIFKRLSLGFKTAGMLISTIVIIVAFILIFDWFPAGQLWPWICFALSFTLCFGVSFFITLQKEKLENQKMAQALERFKNEDN